MENEKLSIEEEIAVLADRDEHRQKFLKNWLPPDPGLKDRERLAVLRGRQAMREVAINKKKTDDDTMAAFLFGALAGGWFIYSVNMFLMLGLLKDLIDIASGM